MRLRLFCHIIFFLLLAFLPVSAHAQSEGGDTIVFETYAPGDSAGEESILGRLKVVSYEKKKVSVVIVPVNGARTHDPYRLNEELDRIYKPAVAEFDVQELDGLNDVSFKSGKVLTHGGSGTFTVYSDDEKACIEAYEKKYGKAENVYVLFYLDNVTKLTADGTSPDVVAGYMPRGYHYGFIFECPVEKYVAHEIGHGAFTLKHTWEPGEQYWGVKERTDNLMDYAGGTELNNVQWGLVHEPDVELFKWLQGEEGNESIVSYNEQILTILRKIREAYLSNESRTELSVESNMEYLLGGPVTSFELGKGTLTYLKIEAIENKSGIVNSNTNLSIVESDNELGLVFPKTRVYAIDPTEMTEKLSSDGEYTYFIYHKLIGPLVEGQKGEDVAFKIVVKTSEKKVLKDYLNPYKISEKQLGEIYPNASKETVKAVTEAINKYCNEFEINTPERMAHFLGQIGAETGSMLEDLSERSTYSARRVVEMFSYNKYGHLFEEAELNKTTYEYTYKPIDYSCNSCAKEAIDKGSSKFSLRKKEIQNAYAEVKVGKEVVVEGKIVKKMLFNDTPRTDVIPDGEGKIKEFVSNDSYNEGKLRVKQQYINSITLFDVVYACRIKNGAIDSRDGSTYKGVGFIHLTGKGNYQSVVDTWNEMHPEDKLTLNHALIEKAKTDVDLAMKLAMAYWKMNELNTFIKSKTYVENECKELSTKINGGDNGLSDRKKYTEKAFNKL